MCSGICVCQQAYYDRIYWITAVDQASILSGYENIAENAGLGFKFENSNSVNIARVVIEWLNREQNWLLIIDNLDDVDVVRGLLPESGPRKHILLTTRDTLLSTYIGAKPLSIEPLEINAAVTLFIRLSGVSNPTSGQEQKAAHIVEELGLLPLAIKQAAAYVREVAGDFDIYCDEYNKNQKEVLSWQIASSDYPYSVSSTWSLSFKSLQRDHPHAVRLLRLLAFLNPDEILIEFLIAGASALDNDLQRILSTRSELAKALIALERFSIVKWDRLSNAVSIHRLVQTVVVDEMSNEESSLVMETMINLCLAAFPGTITSETLSVCRKYQSQIVEPLLRLQRIRTTNAFVLKKRVALFLRNDGKFNDSERLLLQVLELCREVWGCNLKTLSVMYDLSWTYGELDRLPEAEDLAAVVVRKRKSLLGDNHPETLSAMQHLAWTWKEQTRLAEATEMFETVLQKQKAVVGCDNADTVLTMHTLGVTYLDQGRLEEAATVLEDVLERKRRLHRENCQILNCSDSIWTEIHLARIYRKKNCLDEAENLEVELLERSIKAFGKYHPTTLTVMHGLAKTYVKQGRLADALQLEKEALEIKKGLLVKRHPDTIRSLKVVASIYRKQGRGEEADLLERKVLE